MRVGGADRGVTKLRWLSATQQMHAALDLETKMGPESLQLQKLLLWKEEGCAGCRNGYSDTQ